MYNSKDNRKRNPCGPVTQSLQLTCDSAHFHLFPPSQSYPSFSKTLLSQELDTIGLFSWKVNLPGTPRAYPLFS